MMKLIAAFRNFANAPKMEVIFSSALSFGVQLYVIVQAHSGLPCSVQGATLLQYHSCSANRLPKAT